MATTVTLKPNAIDISGSTSGTTTLQATAVAGTTTLTLPAATDTLVGKDTTDTLTNKTLTGAVMNGTVGATTPASGAFTTLSATGVTTVQAGTAALPAITTTGDTNTGIFFPAADTIAFTEGGAEAMRITSAGDVGIGTSSPTTKVQITRTALSGFLSRTSATLTLEDTAGTELYFASNTAGYGQLRFGDTDSNFRGAFTYDHSVDSMYFVTAGSERMRIDSSGNVGIAQTDPTTNGVSGFNNLVIGNSASTAAGITLRVSNSTTPTTGIVWARNTGGANGFVKYDQTNEAMQFGVAGVEKMRIDSSGNVGIGTTSTAGYALAIQRTGDNALMKLTAVTSGGAGIDLINAGGSEVSYVGASGNNVLTFRTGGTERMRIDAAGNAQLSTGAVMPYAPAPAAISAATTLTNANIQGQIISATGTTYTITMPLGTTLETLATWAATNISYDFYVINTASGTVTMAVNTGVTSLGGLTIATGVSAHFRIRRTATNTFVLYRLS